MPDPLRPDPRFPPRRASYGEVVHARCRCCRLPFTFADAGDVTVAAYCPACREHIPADTDTAEAENARLREHLERWQEQIKTLAGRGQERERDVRRLRYSLDDAGFKIESQKDHISALRDVLGRIRDLHRPPGGSDRCECGAKAPCLTARLIDAIDGV